MANHAEEIMKIKTSFGEGDIVKPEIKGWNDARKGKAPQRLKENQNATAKMFADTFGFRGVQFGNWENQVERQSVMNAAYEGRGLASMVQTVMEQKAREMGIHLLRSEVLPHNAASLRFFTRNGFTETRHDTEMVYLEKALD